MSVAVFNGTAHTTGRRALAALFAVATTTVGVAAIAPVSANAQEATQAPEPGAFFSDEVREGTYGIISGSTVTASISNLPEGAKVTSIGPEGTNFLAEPADTTVDKETGLASAEITGLKVPSDAALIGKRVQITYEVEGESTTFDANVRVAPDQKPVNENRFDVQTADLNAGLYQSEYSAKNDALFVTRSDFGEGEDAAPQASLFKVDPNTLAVEQEVDVNLPVFGIALDGSSDTIWATNTVDDSVSVYKQSDMSVVKEFGGATHAREVAVDEKAHRAYVSLPTDAADGVGKIQVYDTEKLEQLDTITLPDFGGPMDLTIDEDSGELFTASLDKPLAAKISLREDNAVQTYALPGEPGDSPSGVAWDPKNRNIWVASQGTNNVVAVNVDSGDVLADLPAANGTLGATYDPATELVYVSNYGAGVVSVFDANSRSLVAHVGVGGNVNNVSVDGKGNAFAVSKESRTVEGKDGKVNTLAKLAPKGGASGSLGSVGDLIPVGSQDILGGVTG